MMRDLFSALTQWLAAGGSEIGEIVIQSAATGFTLTHREEVARPDLAAFVGPAAARQLANGTDAGEFRPLKTLRNLRHGWRLAVADVPELRQALDYFYPAMTGVWLSHRLGVLTPVPLRATLERQTGMYRVTQRLTDEQASGLIASLCGGCLKRRLWEVEGQVSRLSRTGVSPSDIIAGETPAEAGGTPAPLPARELPLLCQEACNLYIAKARELVKSTPVA